MNSSHEEKQSMPITFPDCEPKEDKKFCLVLFEAEQNKKRIICAVTWNALRLRFGGKNVPLRDCFRAARHAIEAEAVKLIEQRCFEADGSILIR